MHGEKNNNFLVMGEITGLDSHSSNLKRILFSSSSFSPLKILLMDVTSGVAVEDSERFKDCLNEQFGLRFGMFVWKTLTCVNMFIRHSCIPVQ